MPIKEWRCSECGFVKETLDQVTGPCPQCGGPLKRRFGFNTSAPQVRFQPHFNWSIGQYVTSMADFKDKLKAKGDERSKAMGLEHRYEMHESGDRVGVVPDDHGIVE